MFDMLPYLNWEEERERLVQELRYHKEEAVKFDKEMEWEEAEKHRFAVDLIRRKIDRLDEAQAIEDGGGTY